MKFYFQVVTTPTADTPGTCALLHFPDKRYFFGQISEGTQRACTERGVKLTSLSDIFLTGRMGWQNTGGLIGVILTQADALASSAAALEKEALEKEARKAKHKNAKQEPAAQDDQTLAQRTTLTIHGPRNLAHTLATARRFVFRKGMPVYTKEYDSEGMEKTSAETADSTDPFETPSWSDNNIKVWAMPIKPTSPLSLSPKPMSRTPSPKSPRKRSLDDFEEREQATSPFSDHEKNQIMRQSVITDMFNSTWRMDALTETPLAEVRQPAVMFVRDPETKDLKRYTGPLPGGDEPVPNINVLVRQPWPGATVEKLPPTKPCKEAVSYVVRNHDIRGKFMPERAKELNVKTGPKFTQLSKGESVVSEDGKVITPDMVLGPARLGKGLAIMDLPTSDYVDALVSRSEWESPSVTTNLEAFLWILGPGVGDHPKLHEFVARMSKCTHTVASTDYCPNYLALASAAGSSVRMAQLRRDNFPVPVHDNVTLPQPGTSTIDREVAQIPAFQPLDPGLIINMEPTFELDRTEVMPRFNTSQIVEKMPHAVEQRMSAIGKRIKKTEFRKKLKAYRDGLPGADVEIIALGTGSSAPSKYRNVSSTLLHVPGSGYYLLDCGENTLGQLKRVFEPEKLREVLQNLRMIWISHLHADHHLGTATLIRAWFEENYPDGVPPSATIMSDMASILRQKRLFVVSEEMMIGWLEEYASVEEYGFSRIVPLAAKQDFDNGSFRTELRYRHCHHDGTFSADDSTGEAQPQITSLRLDDETSPLTPLLRSATGLSNLIATNVAHCRGAMAVTLAFPDGFKASFSGDCRPSPVFATAGQGSTVLIHEATFHNNMQGSAIAKKHSTIAEALEVGRQMNARSIFLTHFSQRYQKSYVDNKYNASSKTQASAATPVREDPPDIPDNDDQVPSLETVPPPPPPTTRPLTAPVVAAFDYMHVRIEDMPFAQAYAPAVGKLIDIFERQAMLEAEKQKAELDKQLAAKQEEKAKRKNKHNKGGKGAAAPPPVKPVAPAAGPEVPKKSPWSASESESGWETSGSEL